MQQGDAKAAGYMGMANALQGGMQQGAGIAGMGGGGGLPSGNLGYYNKAQ
jgi:hypothetical protein